MRILFLLSSPVWAHTLPDGFLEAGHETRTMPLHSGKALFQTLIRYRPDFVVTIGWGKEQSKKNQLIIRKCLQETNIPHVYWSVEDPEYTSVFSLPLIQHMRPDFVFTICPAKVPYYQKLGYRAAHMDFGFAPKLHRSLPCEKRYPIAMVANAYPAVLRKHPAHFRHRALQILVAPLLEQNIRIDFWGHDWDKMGSILPCDIAPEQLHGPVPYQDASQIYNLAEIVLGLQNYEDQVTQRTYEILASGGFLITTDTAGVRSLFAPGEDLVCSAAPEQTLWQIDYYLNNPNRRETIARRGQRRVQEFSYENRAEYMLRVLTEQRIIG